MINQVKNVLLMTIATQVMMGCSSTYRPSESFDQKVARYQAQTYAKNETPELPGFQPHWEITSKVSKTGRAPASVRSSVPETKNSIQSQSTKKLYFLSLYTQFEKLSSFEQTQAARVPSVCPHFHSSLVEHQEEFNSTNTPKTMDQKDYTQSLIQNIKENPEKLAYHPELALPVDTNSLTPRVIDLIDHNVASYSPLVTQALVEKAMGVHLNKTKSELSELCEFGSSDNYYIYENMVSQTKRSGGIQSNSEGLKTLFKTSLIYNQALIQSLKGKDTVSRSPASQVDHVDTQKMYHDEVLKRLQADWMGPYFSEL